MSTPRTVKGTRDLLPPETDAWVRVETTAREVFSTYGYGEIRTPILESTELFRTGIGEGTDIVGKEMYTFPDRKGRELCLRPESTAAVARAFIQHNLGEGGLPIRLFYIGPHFRYERPQKGRYRQFSQIGAELIGDPGPHSDAELITMLVRFLSALGFEDLTVLLNTVGDPDSRAAYREALVEFLTPHAEALSEDSRRRLTTNPLRILDSKSPEERALLESAPNLADHLSAQSRAHYEQVKAGLDGCGVTYREEPRLVRGLDYYSMTVFEIISEDLGAQDAIVGGGRYDGLIETLGGPPIPAIGFAIGLDRLVSVLPAEGSEDPGRLRRLELIPVGDVPRIEILRIAEDLRRRGLDVVADYSVGKVSAALKKADRRGSRFVGLIGEDELKEGVVTLKDLRTGEQAQLAPEALNGAIEGAA